MSVRRTAYLAVVCLLSAIMSTQSPASDAKADPPESPIAGFLKEGRLADGERAMQERLKEAPRDGQARMALGTIQFLRAIERLAQDQYRYGLLQGRITALPLMRIPIPTNDNPEKISYEQARGIIERFTGHLRTAEQTLSKIDVRGVRLPMNFYEVRLDLNGDGKATAEEALWTVFASLAGVPRGTRNPSPRDFIPNRIVFDDGDVYWLRGYCHLLMGLGDMVLAHDWKELFERTGHLYYPRIETPYKFLQEEERSRSSFAYAEIVDLVAAIHLVSLPVVEPDRMRSALRHLETVIELSRKSWKLYLAETDDDCEWIPNPQQKGVFVNVRVRQEMIEAWYGFLDEFEALLKGEKLVPFWRGGPIVRGTPLRVHPKLGVNLRRVFTEPRRFDLVLWIQGTGAAPYLEEGKMTNQEVWEQLQQVFRGRFVGFAMWFN